MTGTFPHDGWIGECVIYNGEAIQKDAVGPEPLVGVLQDPIHFALNDQTTIASSSSFATKGAVFNNASGQDLEVQNIRLRMGSVAGSGEVVVALCSGASNTIGTILGRFPYDTTTFSGSDFYVPVREGGEPLMIPDGNDFVILATRQDGVGTDSNGTRYVQTWANWDALLPAGVTTDGGFRSNDLVINVGATNTSPSGSPWCCDFTGGVAS